MEPAGDVHLAHAPPGRVPQALRAVRAWFLGRRDTQLPTLALMAPALIWLGVTALVGAPREAFPVGDHAKIELYTRLAASGDQRLGTEGHFFFHHPGPGFFYAAVPVYELLGERSAGLDLAALLWNLVALAAIVRAAGVLAPDTGPFVAAFALAAFVDVRGIGWLSSSWNPHTAVLPFAVALLAAARLATGERAALPILLLAGSLAAQCHIVLAMPVGLVACLGLALALLPGLRAG